MRPTYREQRGAKAAALPCALFWCSLLGDSPPGALEREMAKAVAVYTLLSMRSRMSIVYETMCGLPSMSLI